MPEAAEATATVNKVLKSDRLKKLEEKKAALQRQIAAELAKASTQARKEDTRSKIIVGAAILAHIELHPETRGGIIEILKKAVTKDRDRELLASKGIL
jgi:hypothetical protein